MVEGNPKLRDELQRITDEYTDWIVGRQIDLIQDLAKQFPHSIRATCCADQTKLDTFVFNCHAFTFRIHTSSEFRELRTDERRKEQAWGPEGAFVASLISSCLRDAEISKDEASDGDFVVYFEDGCVKHSGVIAGNLVESKWGTAHTWKHGLWEVPSKYGCEVRYYRKVPSVELLAKFLSSLNKPEKG